MKSYAVAGMKWPISYRRYGETGMKSLVWDNFYEGPDMKWLLVWNDPKYEVVTEWSGIVNIICEHYLNIIFPLGMEWHQKCIERGMKCMGPYD